MRTIIKKLFNWVFKSELQKLNSAICEAKVSASRCQNAEIRLMKAMDAIDIGVDVHEQRAPSWAVVSLQGKKADYVKFVDLKDADIREIAQFLSKFDRAKVDAHPTATAFLKFERRF